MENFIYDRLNWTLLLRIIYYFGKPVQGTNNYCAVVLVVELEHVTSASNTEGPKSFSRVGCGEHVSCNGIFFSLFRPKPCRISHFYKGTFSQRRAECFWPKNSLKQALGRSCLNCICELLTVSPARRLTWFWYRMFMGPSNSDLVSRLDKQSCKVNFDTDPFLKSQYPLKWGYCD